MGEASQVVATGTWDGESLDDAVQLDFWMRASRRSLGAEEVAAELRLGVKIPSVKIPSAMKSLF